MPRKFPHPKVQLDRARIIAPYLRLLEDGSEDFQKDVENLRAKYKIPKGSWENPLRQLLEQDYWNPGFQSNGVVTMYDDDRRILWRKFHEDVEALAKKYRLETLPSILKEFVLENWFGDGIRPYRMEASSD